MRLPSTTLATHSHGDTENLTLPISTISLKSLLWKPLFLTPNQLSNSPPLGSQPLQQSFDSIRTYDSLVLQTSLCSSLTLCLPFPFQATWLNAPSLYSFSYTINSLASYLIHWTCLEKKKRSNAFSSVVLWLNILKEIILLLFFCQLLEKSSKRLKKGKMIKEVFIGSVYPFDKMRAEWCPKLIFEFTVAFSWQWFLKKFLSLIVISFLAGGIYHLVLINTMF